MAEGLGLRKITDVLDNALDYISRMRSANDSVTISKQLGQYIWEYFREVEMTKEMLEGLAMYLVDKTYRTATEITIADKFTFAFFADVMAKLWDAVQARGVDTFYILDNTMTEERFGLVYNIFRLSGFCVVTPYLETADKSALETQKEKTVHIVMDPPLLYDYCSIEAVEAQIRKFMRPIQNIVYIEIDSRVNYLEKVRDICKDSNYLSIFRNADPSDKKVEIIKSKFIGKKS